MVYRFPAAARIGLAAALLTGWATAASAGAWELKVCADPDNLPFSNRAGEGFDNKIAAILADELEADLSYVWLPDTRARTRQRFIQGGGCDVVIGVIDGQPGFLTSYAYYRTGYVFIYPEESGLDIRNLNDPALRELRVGVPGGTAKLVPPSLALANRGIVDNQYHFADRRNAGERHMPLLEALGKETIDVAIAWGPLAAAYARDRGGMVVAPVKPEIDVPFIPMVASLAIGVRPEDEGLRDDIDLALSRTWDRTRAVLADAAVPLIDLPPPAPGIGGGG